MTDSEILGIWNGPTSVCNRAKVIQFAHDLAEMIPDWRTLSVSELAAGNPSLKAYSDDLESRVKAAPPVGTLGQFDGKELREAELRGMERAARLCEIRCQLIMADFIRAEIDRMRGEIEK